jgi:hypothetical protein
MVAHGVAHHAAEMFRIQRDDVVQDLLPTTADPSLGQTILSWRLHARAPGLQARGGQQTGHLRVKLSVPIQDDVAISHQQHLNGVRECPAVSAARSLGEGHTIMLELTPEALRSPG